MAMGTPRVPILSTAGAIPVPNDKGGFTMAKVKVSRYVAGKSEIYRGITAVQNEGNHFQEVFVAEPDYAPEWSDEEDDVEFSFGRKVTAPPSSKLPEVKTDAEKEDRRLRRLQERVQKVEDDEEDRVTRHRRLHEPEVLAMVSDEEEEEEGLIADESDDERRREQDLEESSEEEELDEEEIERRRALLRERAKVKREDDELMDVEDEVEGSDAEESSEWEEYTDSEEEDTGPRLKPVFVRKKDRVTIQEKEKEAQKQKEMELEEKRQAEERRRQTLRLVQDSIKRDMEQQKQVQEDFDGIITDDENDEEEYEVWKVRELKRIKRDREERDAREREELEVERIRNMTEEDRAKELKNSRVIVNEVKKGRYKFLQKYYHRGAFFLDEDEHLLKRDFAQPTLEDHFDKSVLPKVMQVKNFGRSGRTKYTHLVDQDTAQGDSPWAAETALGHKYQDSRGAGVKQIFERPSSKRKK